MEAYYARADELLLEATLWVAGSYLASLLVVKNPAGVFLAAVSFVLTTFLVFSFFELFPSLIPAFRLDAFSGYYAYKVNYIADPALVFREKPYNRSMIYGFTGTHYSPVYGIEVSPMNIEWIMDENGFRNPGHTSRADIVVLGDSYIEYGETNADTFPGRLEKHLPGLKVQNLGKSGYAPFQYLEVFKRFGLSYEPQYALMAFYEGNDLQETRDYLLWRSGKVSEVQGDIFRMAQTSFWRRYWLAASTTTNRFAQLIEIWKELTTQRIAKLAGRAGSVHPDVAVVNLNGTEFRQILFGRLDTTRPERVGAGPEFEALRGVFAKFRDVSRDRGIKPIIIYIPTPAHIYARYTTDASGFRWRQARRKQITASESLENEVKHLADKLGLDFVSLSPVFARAAEAGKMLYYPLDAHWNEEGRELAAEFVAGLFGTGTDDSITDSQTKPKYPPISNPG